jgi:ABC-2 type transport system permease protein
LPLHLGPNSLALLGHLVVLHGICAAPIYGWLLLVSAWAPRAPFAWAVLPPVAIGILERVAFGTTYFADLFVSRLGGGANPGATSPVASPMDAMVRFSLAQTFVAPGFWIGLVTTALLVTATVRLRRSAQPI